MRMDVITERDELLIRRIVLEPGESTPWHSDACRRFTVVIQGDGLTIEYQQSGISQTLVVSAGLADWNEPEPLIHRAVNTGATTFEEVVTFYRSQPEQEPQPETKG